MINRVLYYIASCLALSLIISCDKKYKNETDIVTHLNKNRVFLVYRATDSKNGFIAKEYNITSSNLTHIGLGYFESNEFKIINIDNIRQVGRDNDILISSLEEYINLADCNVLDVEIWEYYKDMKSEQITELIKIADSLYNKSSIRFDDKIDYKESDKMYCSELVSNLLNRIIMNEYEVKTFKKKLPPIHQYVLKKDTLEYISVDYFTTLSTFKKVYSLKK